MEFLDLIVKFRWISWIGSAVEVSSFDDHIETEEHINIIR